MKKKYLKQISELAARIPNLKYCAFERPSNNSVIAFLEGKLKQQPETKSVYHVVNKYRRLKRAFKKSGSTGLHAEYSKLMNIASALKAQKDNDGKVIENQKYILGEII